MMKCLVLTERVDDPCYRYRIEAFLPSLARRGFEVETVCLRRNAVARTLQLLRARAADVVLLQRKLLSVAQVGLLRCVARRLVYDLDDALYHRHSDHPKGPHSWKLSARFWAMMRAADLVLVGNECLEEQAARHADRSRVHVVPTCVEPQKYPIAEHRAVGAQAKLAWVGQACTLQGFRAAAECLEAAGRRLPGLELRVICDTTIDLPGLRVSLCRWSLDTETRDLATSDIGISWLPDHPFSRGKCGLKVLQYMAAGLPVVANPVGVTPQLVVHGRTGFLASTPTEWAEAIAELAGDPALRRRMGAEGRRIVETHYSVDRWAARFAGLIAGIVDDGIDAIDTPASDLPRAA
jgi:glycosyltransferase involved in cell wall biosynthesis